GSRHTTYPFFSRAIGLKSFDDTSVPVPIDGGLKLTGKLAGTDFGALAVQTRAAAGDPRSDFTVARVKEDVGRSSYVGGLFTHADRAGLPSSSTYGADAGVRLFPELTCSGFWVKTSTPGLSGHDAAWDADVAYQSEWVQAEIERGIVGSNYAPALGYV